MRTALFKLAGIVMLALAYVLLTACGLFLLAVLRFHVGEDRVLTACFFAVVIASFGWLLIPAGKQLYRGEPTTQTPAERRAFFGGFLAMLFGTIGIALSDLMSGTTAGLSFAIFILSPALLLFAMHLWRSRSVRI